MRYTVETQSGNQTVEIEPEMLLIAGYTGRDQAAVAAHIEELAQHGIAAPERVPSVFVVSGARLTGAAHIDVVGEQSAGEAEFVLFDVDGHLLVGLASDHTDRRLEADSVVKAKQVCDKPVGNVLWPYSELAGHWDELLLRAEVYTERGWEHYQDGSVAEMLDPRALLTMVGERIDTAGNVVFGGTVPIIGGEFIYGTQFRITLTDPVFDRTMTCEYAVRPLPESSL